jgi:hypothetical protein
MVGARRFWPDEHEQPQFKAHCRFCDKSVEETTATLQNQLATLVADASQAVGTVTMQYA